MPGKNRISLNGFDRMWRMMTQTMPILPYLPEAERRAMQNFIDEKKRLDTLTDERRLIGLNHNEQQVYALTRHADNTYTFYPPETAATDVRINGELPKGRYHDRQFSKDYAKKKKAKRRQQKQSRRHR